MKLGTSPEPGKGRDVPGSVILSYRDLPIRRPWDPGSEMTGQVLAESQGGRAGQGSVRMRELKALGLHLCPCEVGRQVPRELWPNPPGGSDRLSRL